MLNLKYRVLCYTQPVESDCQKIRNSMQPVWVHYIELALDDVSSTY